MATRHQAREAVVGLLYAKDIGNENIEKFIDDIFEEKKIRNQQKDFALELFNGVLNSQDRLDEVINSHLKEWKVDKIGHIERAILRLGVYEMIFTELDEAVIINEAIEVAKELTSDSGPKFINGVLDAIKKDAIKKAK